MECLTDKHLNVLVSQDVILNRDDLSLVEQYLKMKSITGQKNMITIRCALLRFFSHVKTTSINKITRSMILSYFQAMEQESTRTGTPISYNYKITQKKLLAAFFRYYEELMEDVDHAYVNPMPKRTLRIEKPMQSPQEESQHIEQSVFTVDQISLILKKTYLINQSTYQFPTKGMFPALILLIMCGMRISECVSIRIANFHLKERYLVTGLEENARKNKKPLFFCFPEKIVPLFYEYILQRQQYKPDSIWLFPGKDDIRDTHLSEITLINFLVRLFPPGEFPFRIHSHSFRRTLSTFRLNGEKPTPLHIEETLSNHSITSLVMRNYCKYSLDLRRRDYDRYFPLEYSPILEYLSNL